MEWSESMKNNGEAVTLVVGLGEVGKPLYTILQNHEPRTIGIDIKPAVVEQPVGILHVCFPFINRTQFQSAVEGYAIKYAPSLIVINSTIVPGTTRAIEKSTGIPCVYSPVRGKHTKMVDELQTYVKFVAGTDSAAAERVQAHFKAAGIPSETMSTPEALELAKLLETTYFGLLIAWAQEMNRFAVKVDADYLEVGKFFKEIAYLPNVLFQPGHIGGHCVMPNIALLQQCFQSEFLEVMKRSNEARKMELAEEEEVASAERLKPLALA
jgi:UDP-N-acetyl-D-mannosaminuronate dehydrogenase